MILRFHSKSSPRLSAVIAALSVLLFATGCESLFATKAKVHVVAKWGRFERTFQSGVAYANALQDARLTVSFSSPAGTIHRVEGFWDGGKTWRVRFSPDQAGRWTYRTSCSDGANRGLHEQAGEFICGAVMGSSRFRRHGPVRVARDHRHFEHVDGTPFFWLADTAWNGARLSTPKDWEIYALTRAHQEFSVVQWAVGPGPDVKRQSAFTGTERIAINPEFFQRLDAQVDTLSRAQLLGAITPLLELGGHADAAARVPEDQAILLVRYVVARWGAEPVVWLLAFEGGNQARSMDRWKRVGQAVFGQGPHAPVVLFPGEAERVLDEFRDQSWVDAFGYPSVTGASGSPMKWAFEGPLAEEWKKEPARPLIPFTPQEDAPRAGSQERFSSDDVRHAAYWGLLITPPAGVSYGARAVAEWDLGSGPAGTQSQRQGLPAWRRAISLPGAEQMSYLARFMEGIDFWKLRPNAGAVAGQPGNASARRFIAAASTEGKELSVIYVPEGPAASIFLKALPTSPLINWYDPRTGTKSAAVAVLGESLVPFENFTCQFPTPGPGDWLLMIKAGK